MVEQDSIVKEVIDPKKVDRQVGLLISVILILFVIFIGVYYYNNKIKYGPSSFEYNGFEVIYVDLGNGPIYKLKVFFKDVTQPSFINLRSDPRVVDDISLDLNRTELLTKRRLYITMHPTNLTSTSVLAGAEISKIVGNRYLFGILTSGAVTSSVPGKNALIKTCNDVNQSDGIILLSLSNQTRIYNDNGCVILEGVTEENLIEAANLLDLYLLGVIK